MTNGVVTLSLATHSTAGDGARVNGTLHDFVAGPENRLAAATLERFFLLLDGDSVGNALRGVPLPTDGSSTGAPRNATEGVPYRNTDVIPCSLAHLSPVVFHGAPGTGKSLLVHGLAEAWNRRRPDDLVVVLTAAEFAQQYADAVDKRAVNGWRNRLRNADLFVLEDLLHLASKPAAQTELLTMLDDLADRGRLAVMTSRLSPHELMSFLPGLQSRLQAGLCVPVVVPEMEARRTILAALCVLRQLTLSDRSLRSLARSLAVPVPELSGVLANLEMAARSSDQALDDKFVQTYMVQHYSARHPPLRTIATHTARHFALRVAELRSASRRRGVVTARDVAMYLSRQLTGKSLKQIGDYFGGRDHTTVLHGCRKTETLMRSDPATLDAVTALRQSLAIG